jgi:small subunit ribosomal protein S16
MAVKIRLLRRGRKKLARYDVIVADSRSPRDGRFVEKLGIYNPNTEPTTLLIHQEKTLEWLLKGAVPTITVRNLLSDQGMMLRKHLQVGVNKGAITQEEADSRFENWMQEKEAKVSGSMDALRKQREEEENKRKAAETKIKEARAEKIREKQIVPEPPAEEAAEESVVPEEAAGPEAPAAENQENTNPAE